MLNGMQASQLIFVLLFAYSHTIKPPGYVEPQKDGDPNPPKYEYGYDIVGDKGGHQGKQEQRDGIYASGRYFVENKNAKTDVQYFADDWGYHPAVEYSSAGPHSKSSTRFALGHEAVVQLRNKENNLPQLQGLPDTGPLNKDGASNIQSQTIRPIIQPSPQPPQQLLLPFPSQQTVIQQNTIKQDPQLPYDPFKQQYIIQEQPQQVIQHEPQQQVLIQEQQQEQQQHHQQVIQHQQQVLIQEQQQKEQQQQQQHHEQQQQQYYQQQVIQHEPQQQVLIQEQQQEQQQQHQQIIQHQQQVLIQEQQQQEQQRQHYQQQQVIQHEPQQQVLIQEQPQIQQYVQHEPQQQQVLIQEQPQLPVVQHEPQQEQQIIIQHIQQPVEKVIFPQPTPTPIVYQNQAPQQLLLKQQPNVLLLDQQKFENSAHIHQNQIVAEKLVQTEDQANAVSYQQFGLKLKGRRPNKLIQSTQHLVTGQDVLDINSAVTQYEETSIPSSTPYPTVTEFTVTEPSFQAQPIVVADAEDNKIVSSTERYNLKEEQLVSTTASTIESVSTTFESTSPLSTIVVTPRPVSTTFLAPITAGVRLESTEQYEDKYKLNKQNVQVEIQKTVPYYLGKYEYPISQDQYLNNHSLVDQKIRQDIELGKTLLYFPGQVTTPKQLTEVDNHINLQQLPNPVVQNNFLELDQQLAQGYQHQIYYQQYPIKETKEVTRLIPQPYPVKVPYEVRVPYVQQVSVPVTVEKIVEKPVHITKVVEKPVAVPQPYPVEKIIDRPVHIPVQVTKYIDRPYPVQVQVPVPQPYPVEKIVKQPYPVEVRVPVHIDRIVEKKVPHYIDRPITVEKIVEKQVPQYIDRPYPVHVKVPYPVDRIVEKKVPVPHYIEKQVPVEKIVEKQVPQYIDRPYPVPQPYYIRVEVPRPYHVQLPTKFIQKQYYTLPILRYHNINYGGVPLAPIKPLQTQLQSNIDSQVQSSYNSHVQSNLHSQVQSSYSNNIKNVDQVQSEGYYYPNPYSYAPQNNFYLPPKKEVVPNNGYLPPEIKNCDDAVAQQTKQDNYIGLLPPKIGNTLTKFLRKYRSARSNFDDKSVKMEYGFMPPLVPSLEIDEYGNPIDKGDK
ncbi:unnamed protein product [Psylliodes chrysocephalus]|uniref:Uncharacterized protein n=1 Tax=Psylliodes chrysocephalus TaxID=3402493 RepID=A0A9P0DB68_9CUCU|nr:unnamed protein product [Psylliodes chrysocephala]